MGLSGFRQHRGMTSRHSGNRAMPHINNGAVDKSFAKALFDLAEALGARISESRIRAYAGLMGDIAMDDVRVAVNRAAREGQTGFFPSVGELLSYLGPTPADRALLAWTALSQAAQDVGAYASIELEDGAAADAVVTVFGSWPAFCAVEEGPQLALKRQEFLAAYRAARRESTMPRRLTGLCGPVEDPQLAGHVWAGYITAGGKVHVGRDRPMLEGADGTGRAALSEGRATQESEGAQEAPRSDGRADGASTGGSERRLLPGHRQGGIRPVQGTERVGASGESSPGTHDGTTAGEETHNGGKPDAMRQASR